MQTTLETAGETSPQLSKPTWRQIALEPTDSTSLQFLRYLFVGGMAFVLDFCSLYLLTSRLGVHFLVSAAVGFTLGLIANYVLSRIWVFSNRSVRSAALEFAIFSGIGLIGLGLNELGIWVLASVAGMNYLVAKMWTTAIVFFWNFAARKLSLFR
jgi:putative flippase GtrA